MGKIVATKNITTFQGKQFKGSFLSPYLVSVNNGDKEENGYIVYWGKYNGESKIFDYSNNTYYNRWVNGGTFLNLKTTTQLSSPHGFAIMLASTLIYWNFTHVVWLRVRLHEDVPVSLENVSPSNPYPKIGEWGWLKFDIYKQKLIKNSIRQVNIMVGTRKLDLGIDISDIVFYQRKDIDQEPEFYTPPPKNVEIDSTIIKSYGYSASITPKKSAAKLYGTVTWDSEKLGNSPLLVMGESDSDSIQVISTDENGYYEYMQPDNKKFRNFKLVAIDPRLVYNDMVRTRVPLKPSE